MTDREFVDRWYDFEPKLVRALLIFGTAMGLYLFYSLAAVAG